MNPIAGDNSYLHFFIDSSIAQGNELAPLTLLFLFLARILPIIALSPFFGARVLSNPTKVFFAFCLFAIFLPQLLIVTKKQLAFDGTLMIYLAKEVFIGMSLGFVMGMPFVIVQSAGIIIDHQRGGASLMVNDPTIQNQSSPLGLLFNMTMIVIFYSINGPFLFLDAIAKSYELVPPDQFLNPAFFNKTAPFWQLQLKLFDMVMVICMQIAAPALIAILMTDLFLGIANRLAPQVQITFLGMPLKSLLGLFTIWLGWSLIMKEFAHQGLYWLNLVNELVNSMQIVTT